MASVKLPYLPHPGLPAAALLHSTSEGPHAGEVKTQGAGGEG